MRVVLCEDDLESSQGKRKGGRGGVQRKKERGKVIETQQWRRERKKEPGAQG